MDKLQPVLAYRFWIAFGVALIVGVVGWWIESSAVAAKIEEREKKIQQAVKDAQGGQQQPNDKWKQELDKFNERDEKLVDAAATVLFDKQQSAKVWPPGIDEIMADVKYRSPASDGAALEFYRVSYIDELRRIYEIVEPYSYATGKGKLFLRLDQLPQFPISKWNNEGRNPTWKEMWDAQEDIWLTEGLLRSFASMNRQATSVRDAPLRKIITLQLHGGSRTAATGSSEGGMSGDEDSGDEDGSESEGGLGSGYGNFGGESSGGGAEQDIKIEFDPKEELGTPDSTNSSDSSDSGSEDSGDEDGFESGGGTFADAGGSESLFSGGSGFGSGGSVSSMTGDRYVDDDPERPFKTRGFYIEAIVRHDMVPDFISELTNTEWPVEVLRVHQGVVVDDDARLVEVNPRTSGGRAPSPTGFGPQNSGFGPPSTGFGAPTTGFGAPGSGFGAPSTGFGVPSTGVPSATGLGAAGSNPSGVSTLEVGTTADLDVALSKDPTYVKVAVCGLMTIYLRPDEEVDEEALIEAGDEGAAPPTEPVEEPPVDPNAPVVDPNGNSPDTNPNTNPPTGDGTDTSTDGTNDNSESGNGADGANGFNSDSTQPDTTTPQPPAPGAGSATGNGL